MKVECKLPDAEVSVDLAKFGGGAYVFKRAAKGAPLLADIPDEDEAAISRLLSIDGGSIYRIYTGGAAAERSPVLLGGYVDQGQEERMALEQRQRNAVAAQLRVSNEIAALNKAELIEYAEKNMGLALDGKKNVSALRRAVLDAAALPPPADSPLVADLRERAAKATAAPVPSATTNIGEE